MHDTQPTPVGDQAAAPLISRRELAGAFDTWRETGAAVGMFADPYRGTIEEHLTALHIDSGPVREAAAGLP